MEIHRNWCFPGGILKIVLWNHLTFRLHTGMDFFWTQRFVDLGEKERNMRGVGGLLPSPYVPWQWNIYLHGWPKSMVKYGKFRQKFHTFGASGIQLKKKYVNSTNLIHLLQWPVPFPWKNVILRFFWFPKKVGLRFWLYVFTFFFGGSRIGETQSSMESILHPPPRCTCVLFEYVHIVRTTIVPMPSPPNDATSGKKTPWHGVCGLDCHDVILSGTQQKTSSSPQNPGCSRIPNPYHWIWIHSISTIFNMFATHLCIGFGSSLYRLPCFQGINTKKDLMWKDSCRNLFACCSFKKKLTTGWSWPSRTMMNQIGFLFPWKSLGFGWW